MRVTLKTLPEATAQEVFDQVATHLFKQGLQSINKNGRCMYRFGDLQCAAGCLIDDDEYDPRWEAKNWRGLVASCLVPNNHSSLIAALQYVHDNNNPCHWPEKLVHLGENYKLSTENVTRLAQKERF